MSLVNVCALSFRCLENDQFEKLPRKNINLGKKAKILVLYLAGKFCMSLFNVCALSFRCLENDQFEKLPRKNINLGKKAKVDVENHRLPTNHY